MNVFLRVLGGRDDGYHDIESMLLPISLADHVTVEEADEVTLILEGPRRAGSPPTRNLVLRAARLPPRPAARPVAAPGSRSRSVPAAAGLGGGSADAAARSLLDELWGTGAGPAALADRPRRRIRRPGCSSASPPSRQRTRRGRRAGALAQSTTWVVKPFAFGVSSFDAYAWWDERAATGPDPGALIAAAEAGDDDLLGSALFNDLQGPSPPATRRSQRRSRRSSPQARAAP